MKKAVVIMLSLFAALFCLFSCSGGGSSTKETKKITLMVYMVGSDLEAKTAAGTNDLQEMLSAGADLSSVNILVYAGGTPKWHNGALSTEEHSLLSLSPEGFVAEKSFPAASMGEPESLQNFLNYSYETHPAESFALILWDHGNGPIIGYGKDMLYGNDSLTLKEMEQAMKASPFQGENKLAWVGFDACLMASAELTCVWAEFAEYLVASQEVEPSFGWNYSFLSELSKVSTVDLLKNLSDGYLSACEEYYEQKGYSGRDTTLSCVDLSKAATLSEAVNNLFDAARNNLSANYNLLAAKRANTRALGRASTGSEYDLIDLGDMAAQLLDLYPTQAAALRTVLEQAVVCNATNAEGCSGLSLYYPYYNKSYYESSWQEAYEDLGVFPGYLSYLKEYGATWLKDDLLTDVARSTLPSALTEGTYQLELTPQQAEAYAGARYFILTKKGEELYQPIFVSRNVKKQGSLLIAGFDGDVFYIKDKFNRYALPAVWEQDTVGDITRYRAPVSVTNDYAGSFTTPEGVERKTETLDFQLAVNNRTKTIAVSALTPRTETENSSTNALMGGKLEDADLSQYSTYHFAQERHYYISRFDNGTVRPLSQWSALSYLSANRLPIRDGVEFVFAPLTAGEYYLIFEIEDTQGNRYCSELLPIECSGTLEPQIVPDLLEAVWTEGNSFFLGTFGGVKMSLQLTETEYDGLKYVVSCENTNSFPVWVALDDVAVNDSVYCQDALAAAFDYIPAGETQVSKMCMNFGSAEAFLDKLTSMTFSIKVQHAVQATTLIRDQLVTVTLPDREVALASGLFDSSREDYGWPVYGIQAGEQVLYQDSSLKVTLMGLGGKEYSEYIYGALRVENSGSTTRYLGVNSLSLDGITLPVSCADLTVYPGMTVYTFFSVRDTDLAQCGISSASSAKLLFRFMEFLSLEGGGGFSSFVWSEISLSSKGTAAGFTEGGRVLFDGQGIRISLQSFEKNVFGGTSWTLTVVNGSDQSVAVDTWDVMLNGELLTNASYVGFGFSDNHIPAGEKAVIELDYYGDSSEIKDLSCKLCFRDLGAEKVLFASNEEITWISGGTPLK